HGVCQRHKQAEYPGPTCQKTSSVAVTQGWGSHDLLADLGNNALFFYTVVMVAQKEEVKRIRSASEKSG
ncbi:hypothetical protein, partial [Aeromonas enteropelogenes]|uniref:hypothetical protein n=1 Tax=Aeromonas enteropelogenes TaxID=29489 RepID=UPI001E367EC6